MLLAAAAGAAEGGWLTADRQTAGRGRMGRSWESPPGNLYASGLVRLRSGDPDAATLTLVTAVAVCETVAALTPAVQLKWPNDVLAADGAKLAGILLERAADAVVIGVGANLAHHPQNLGCRATSIAAMGVVPPEPLAFLESLSRIFGRWLGIWREEGLGEIRAAWLKRAHPVGSALIANLPDGEAVRGSFDGLTDDCALRLRLADGAVRVIHAGDVFLI